jgi:hypothetical protein
MTREQARSLWLSTLALPELPPGEGQGPLLQGIWDAAGLAAGDRAGLTQALRGDDALARREALVRATRRLLAAHGYEVDLLTTPAAAMRGI